MIVRIFVDFFDKRHPITMSLPFCSTQNPHVHGIVYIQAHITGNVVPCVYVVILTSKLKCCGTLSQQERFSPIMYLFLYCGTHNCVPNQIAIFYAYRLIL